MSKKVLIVTYYWIPAGGPGVQRWLKFVKYLPDFGISPVVYIPENPTYPILDTALEEDLKDITLIKQPIREPYRWARLLSVSKTSELSSGLVSQRKKQNILERLLLFIRGNFFIPDARIAWVKPSVAYLEKYLKEHQIDTIITTGPPHSVHLIGLELKKKLNLKWIADFRDPWTNIVYHKELKLTQRSQKKHKEMESSVLQTADHILVTSPSTKTEFSQKTDKIITVLTNGYDVERIEKKPLDEKFTLAHIGSLLSGRNPRVLWKALKELLKEQPDFREDFLLKLVGVVSQEVRSALEEFGISSYVEYSDYLSHNQAIMCQRSAQVLLLIEADTEETKSILPGKLYEYMASNRPILAIAHEESDIKQIIVQTNTGVFFDYTEMENIKKTLWDFYKKYKSGQLTTHPIGLQYFSRKNLTQKLSKLL